VNKLVSQHRELNLNLNNYDEDDVLQLNAWAIEAVQEIEILEDKVKVAQKAFQDIIDAANRM
jgi:hypothetical protein